MYGAAGLISAYGQAEASRAQGIYNQTAFMLQARDTLAIANVRADMDMQYAQIQAGRTLKKAEVEAQNYTIAGNTLLKNMRATNAAIRARAAASGISYGEGSAAAVQQENVAATMRDVGITDLNALTARVMGFEDASAMMQSTELQNILNRYAAERQAGQYQMAGAASRRMGGLMADFTLANAAIQGGRTLMGSTPSAPARDALATWRRTGSGGD